MGRRLPFIIVALIAATAVAVTLWANRSTPTGSLNKRQPFHIAFNEWVGFAPFFLARDKGFYDDLPVELHFIALEGDKRSGLYANRFQMICETLDMYQTSRDAVPYPGRIVFAIDESYGGDGILASNQVQSLQNLKRRTVAVESGQPAHFLLQYLLHKEGLTLRDVNLRPMASADAATAFIARRVDVAGTYEPYLTQALRKRSDAHLLVSSKDVPGLITDVAITSDETLRNRREEVRRVYAGWCKALDYIRTHRQDAITAMAKHFNQTPKEFEDAVSGLRYLDSSHNTQLFGTPQKPGPIHQKFSDIGAILKENGLTSALDQPQAKIDTSVVQSTTH